MHAYFSRENPRHTLKGERGAGMEESRKEHLYMLKTDHVTSLKLRTGKHADWCSGNTF